MNQYVWLSLGMDEVNKSILLHDFFQINNASCIHKNAFIVIHFWINFTEKPRIIHTLRFVEFECVFFQLDIIRVIESLSAIYNFRTFLITSRVSNINASGGVCLDFFIKDVSNLKLCRKRG